MSTSSTPTPAVAPSVHYPNSDGRPIGETSWHVDSTFGVYGMLRDRYGHRQDVYVAVNMFLYYEEGNPRANRSPDCMVIFGVQGNHPRGSFKTWIEGAVPSVIFEFSSEKTFREDLHDKRELYARLGVAEYFLFDPIGDCLDPRLMGFRLEGPGYVEMTPGADGGLTSRILGLRLVADGAMLRLFDLETGLPLLTTDDKTVELRRETLQREQEQRRADREQRRADRERRRAEKQRLKAERAKQRAEKLRLKAERAQRRAEQQRLQAEQERLRTEQERLRAEELAIEVERLRALLREQGRGEGDPAGPGGVE